MKTFYTLLIVLVLAGCSKEQQAAAPQAPSVPVATIAAANTMTYQLYPVAIEGKVNVEIRPQVSGRLEKIFVDEGAYVQKGQLLFKIDEQPFREQYNNAKASLNAAEAAETNAGLEVEKLGPLVQNKVVSDFQLKTAKANQKAAHANVQQAKAIVASAKINLGYTSITAPVSGYIARLPKKAGSLVSASDAEPITKLSNIDEVYVYFALSENDFINFKSSYNGATINDKVKNLLPVTLLLADNSEYQEKGKIDVVDGEFNENTGAITVRATFPNPKGLLRSGNTGKIKLGLNHDKAILVSQESTIEIQDKVYVFTLSKDNKVSKVPIAISGKTSTDYLVTNGLASGDRIVVAGFENLQEGTVITPQKSTATLTKN